MAHWTWPAMCGNGVQIGTVRIPTNTVKTGTPKDQKRVTFAWCAAARGAAIVAARAVPSAPGTTHATAATIWGCVSPGRCNSLSLNILTLNIRRRRIGFFWHSTPGYCCETLTMNISAIIRPRRDRADEADHLAQEPGPPRDDPYKTTFCNIVIEKHRKMGELP